MEFSAAWKAYSSNVGEEVFSEVIRAATTTTTALLPERGYAICVILCTRRAEEGRCPKVKRLLEALNNPKVALVVGVVAVGVNGLLYFFYYLPRMTLLIEQIQSIDKPLSEVVSKPEVISEALPEAPSDPPPESPQPQQQS